MMGALDILAVSSTTNIDKGPAFSGVGLAFAMTALVFVGLRMFVRVRMIHSTGLDDYLILLAMVSRVTSSAIAYQLWTLQYGC